MTACTLSSGCTLGAGHDGLCYFPPVGHAGTVIDNSIGPTYNSAGVCAHNKRLSEHCLLCGGDSTYEVIKVLEAWLTTEEFIGALKFNIIKYQARANHKGGVQDLEKSHQYSQFLIDFCRRKGVKLNP
jgi:hypothetical protein